MILKLPRVALLTGILIAASCGDDRPAGTAGNDSSLVGGTCMNGTECDELLCQTGPQFPGNVCTISCGDSGMCPQGSFCAALDRGWICLVRCGASEDCRTDWECLPVVEAPPPLSGESPTLVNVCIGPEAS